MYSLWYQLTVALIDFTQKEENYVNDNMITVSSSILFICNDYM